MIDPEGYLTVAVRAYTERRRKVSLQKPQRPRRRGRLRRRELPPFSHALIFDTETTDDAAQGLLFGAFRYARIDWTPHPVVTTVAEGLIYADDLCDRDPAGFRQLQDYAASRKADVDMTYPRVEPDWELHLWSRREFVDKWLHRVGYRDWKKHDPALIVAFNAPFDLSRIAVDAGKAYADMYGGFSLVAWIDGRGDAESWRPRIAVKAIDSKRSLKKLRKLKREGKNFTGHLLDLRTLVFALTGDSHSLASAAKTYGVTDKGTLETFGVINTESIDYCRLDVTVTTELLQAVLADYASHPIDLQATQAYSPASIAKAYLQAMGIQPRLVRQPLFPKKLLGLAMSAFYGGRAEVHIRHQPLPVALVDFTSMYPSVDILLGVWDLVTADRVDIVDVTDEIRQLLDTVTAENCFDPALWQRLMVIVQIVPDADVLPVRASYGPKDPQGDPDDPLRERVLGYSIGVNPFHADQPFWYPLPDLINSKNLTGRTPQIVQAWRFEPAGGTQPDLVPVALRGEVSVDPTGEDFFRRVIESRQEIRSRVPGHMHDVCPCADCRLQRFLKVLANSGSYGIYAETRRVEHADRKRATVHGPAGQPFDAQLSTPEEPGRYCFPPIAACITGAARLMLGLLEHQITAAGGQWMFCDTDSLAIVATQTGGLLPCPGGEYRLDDRTPAVKAVRYAEVDAIRSRFQTLHPYDRSKVKDLLKREETGICLAISAKRYVIYQHQPDGSRRIVKRSQHGLGRYLDPVTPKAARRDDDGNLVWVDDAWQWILDAHNDPETPLPVWVDRPALSQISVSSYPTWLPFRGWNEGRPWAEQIKPFNFLLVADVDPAGYPPGVDPTRDRFRLIAPFTSDSDRWLQLEWRNLYDPDGRTYRIATDRDAPVEPGLVIVKSYATVLREYRLHPEHKFHSPDGTHCRRLTRGVMQRRPVHLDELRLIGKEANSLDDVQSGSIAQLSDVLNEYAGPDGDRFHQLVLPVLTRYSGRELARRASIDRRTIDRVRCGASPRHAHRAQLITLAASVARDDLRRDGCLGHREAEFLAPLVLLRTWHEDRRLDAQPRST